MTDAEMPAQTTSSQTGNGPTGLTGLVEHDERGLLLGEMHARPFAPVATPCRVLRLAFLTSPAEAVRDREAICALATARGLAHPAPDARFFRLAVGPAELRWEQHTEFTTYTWSLSLEDNTGAQLPQSMLAMLGTSFRQPGRLIAAIDLWAIDKHGETKPPGLPKFDPNSVCAIAVDAGAGDVRSDFQVDQNGFIRFLVQTHGMSEIRTGVLLQRIMEMETYRTLALLGLPVARRASPQVDDVEAALVALTRELGETDDNETEQKLLRRLTSLAARMEAQIASSAFRFSASRAYAAIVEARLESMHESKMEGETSFSAFFRRRLDPALATCNAVEERQRRLSARLFRTAELLRTRVQFEVEQQNRALLQSMNRRGRMQLRLQQTVEGLSIAAISYYVVGLASYVFKGMKSGGVLPSFLSAELLTALSVPIAIGSIWLLVRRIRSHFSSHEGGEL